MINEDELFAQFKGFIHASSSKTLRMWLNKIYIKIKYNGMGKKEFKFLFAIICQQIE